MYPETKNQVLKNLHVLLKFTWVATFRRFLAISCDMHDWISDSPKCLVLRASGYLYNSSAGSHSWLRRFWIFEVKILGEICRKFQWQKGWLFKPETNRSLKCLHRVQTVTVYWSLVRCDHYFLTSIKTLLLSFFFS